MSQVIIDVREKDEFAAEHAPDSVNIPLSSFAAIAPGVLNQLKDRKITFMCRSGARASQAQAIASGLGFNDAHSYDVFEGGLMAWKLQGKQISQHNVKAPLPLMRQVQLLIGAMVIAFALLGAFVNSTFAIGAAAVGAGLFLAGATGFCALATLMGKLPWNRGDLLAQKRMCAASSNNGAC
ncbi:MAG: rhodanese-like domain-containing protein [Gammaproteobacteria bacterium]|nr:rhodanese-like domain-containing protein [Gammaproteobacteria bacterium]MDH5730378.1 rhodanese-like domain-containing protein [Gammaproteobacteria bacterium]